VIFYEEIQKELDNIRQRLIVLERIVTDKNHDFNEELSKIKGMSVQSDRIG